METIFHIPHSSIYIPEEYRTEFVLSDISLKKEKLKMCDSLTDKLVDKNESIIFPYSRIFCDVERYNSDLEEMNKVGMGVFYTKTHDLKTLRENPSKDIIKFYNYHHKKLNDVVRNRLKIHDEILFIDLHSYSNEPSEYELYKNLNRPDICFGINDRYNKKILKKLIYIAKKFGYSYSTNEPFKGCLLPTEYIDDERVNGIMIEINKDVINLDFSKIKSFLQCVKKI